MRTSLRELPAAELKGRLASGLKLRIGPFVVCIQGRDPLLANCLAQYYPDYPLAPVDSFVDARLMLRDQAWWARLLGRPREICLEDEVPFTDFPANALLAHIEWSLNWCIATRANQYLMLHGGVLARDEGAMIMPGVPGAGKSTLTAFLMHRGWRLFSDEFTLLKPGSMDLQPFPRLIPLKNDSIEIIQTAVPEAAFGPQIPGTRKGRVSHLRPIVEHLRRMDETARPKLVVFPSYKPAVSTTLTEMARSEAFAELTNNAFNYVLLGRLAFEMVAELTDAVRCFRLSYSQLEDANLHLQALLSEGAA